MIRHVPSILVAGRRRLSHTFDYVIPAWHKTPERILKAINTPTKAKVQSPLYAMVNDTEPPMAAGAFIFDGSTRNSGRTTEHPTQFIRKQY